MTSSRFSAVVLSALALSACAASPHGEVSDPAEGVNRGAFSFNEAADSAVFEPVARGYRDVVPAEAREGIGNAVHNLRSPVIFVNDVLQGEPRRAADTLGRFMINTTFGVFGIFDVAASAGVMPHDEDFGQTLAVWGVGEGPYVMLPLLGPSNARDAAGKVVDFVFDPLSWVGVPAGATAGRVAVETVDRREALIEPIEDMRRTSTDLYATVRAAYGQNRSYEILNGAMPSYTFEEWDGEEE